MKCPHCSTDLKGKDICGTCGRKVEPAPGIEVEYKDFKVSEFLEIRQKEHRTFSGTGSFAQDSEQQETRRSVPGIPEMDEADTGKTTPAGGGRTGKTLAPDTPAGKRSFAVAIILLLLVAVAGALYHWRFLMR